MKTEIMYTDHKTVEVRIANRLFTLIEWVPTGEKHLLVYGKNTRRYEYNVKLPQNYLEVWWNLDGVLRDLQNRTAAYLTGEDYTKIANAR